MENTPRIWVYGHSPLSRAETMYQTDFLVLKANLNGGRIVGVSEDYPHGRPRNAGFRAMLAAVRRGRVDEVYVTRMESISTSRRTLYRFLKQLMLHDARLVTVELEQYKTEEYAKLTRKVKRLAARKRLPLPWA